MGRKIREGGKEKTCFFGKAFFSKERFMLKDERGQLSIDFLVGISLFILALLFMAHFIPGMFVPFQSETIDLNSVAYRTSVILVEDPGWWDDETGAGYGTDWDTEGHIGSVRRVGLAIDKEHPNVLKMSKIEGFKACTNLTDTLGLHRMIGDNEIDYGYNISLPLQGWGGPIMQGESAPSSGDVVTMKRIVSVIISDSGAIDAANMAGAQNPGGPDKPLIAIDSANVSRFCNSTIHPLKISITNFSINGPHPKFMYVKIVQTNLSEEAELLDAGDVGVNLRRTGNGLHIATGTKLNSETDGTRQVKYNASTFSSEEYLGSSVDFNSPNNTLMLIINNSAFIDAGITTSGDDPGDIVIEIKLSDIDCNKAESPDDLPRYPATPAIDQIPLTLIVKVWT